MSWDHTTAQTLPSTEVTHFHFLRHGQVDTGGARRAYGHTDYPLSATGEEQGKALIAHALDRLPRPDGIWSSDLVRCTAIAEPLARALGVPLHIDPALREQHMGDWEGQTWAALTEADVQGTRAYWTDYATTRPPGGESYGDMATRIDAFFATHADELRGKRWFFLSHVGVIRAATLRLLSLPPSEALRFTPMPGTHS
jgi:alpha-ribazole phosphatase